jgi:hypothetical protein
VRAPDGRTKADRQAAAIREAGRQVGGDAKAGGGEPAPDARRELARATVARPDDGRISPVELGEQLDGPAHVTIFEVSEDAADAV